MKTKILSLVLLSLTTILFSCDPFDHHVVPGDDVSTRNENFEDYDMIDASSAFTVYVSFSDTEEEIEIEANDNLHQYIEVKKINNTLHIGLRNNISVRGSATLKAYVTTRHVSSYSGSGASRFVIESPLETEDANVQLSGASVFTGDLDVNTLSVDLSGASVMNITGSANILEAEASGASVLKDYGFYSQTLIAELSGASSIFLTVDDEIDVEASGASTLHYKGSAVIIHQDLSGASSIKKVN
jgi:hypothetical protein